MRIRRLYRAAAIPALIGLIFAGVAELRLNSQQAGATQASLPAATFPKSLPEPEPTDIALPLPEDRGQAALAQSLRRLSTTASVMAIVAHPDDEDGALLTYLSRGHGARASLLTLTRGEGGQNAMSADADDAMGLIRTNELDKASEYYGAKQIWGTEVDFGFSKTQAESFARWGHDRVLYDAVLAVRRERPQIIVATFMGGVSDGHGQHQVSGEIAQEVFKAAADPKVFPEQLKDGLEPWQPLAMYSRAPFAQVTSQGIFDYATGKWEQARFRNYITGEWLTGVPSADVEIPVGTLDPVLGRSYVQIAREGWGQQKSQYGGASPALSGPAESEYHLWAVAPAAKAAASSTAGDTDLYHNSKVNIDTSIEGLAKLAKGDAPAWLSSGLREIDAGMKQYVAQYGDQTGTAPARKLAPMYRRTLDLYARVADSNLDAEAKAGLTKELGAKIEEFQSALRVLLGLDMSAFTASPRGERGGGGPQRGGSPDESPRSVAPGQEFRVKVHTSQAAGEARLSRVWLQSYSGDPWKAEDTSGPISPAAALNDRVFQVRASANAEPTQPYFTKPNVEQPYYDVAKQEWRGRSWEPYPLAAWAEYSFDGVPIRLGEVVQTMEMVRGPGGIYEPLVVTPPVGVRVEPEARILPLDGSPLPVTVTVHTQSAADGSVDLKLPAGWRSEPAEAQFHLKRAGDSEPLVFSVTPGAVEAGAYAIKAEAHVGGHSYETGWRSIGYPGLRPYNMYTPAELKTRKVDVKVAPGLRVGYFMGTGDTVPEAMEELGVAPHMLSLEDLTSGNLSAWNVIVIGIRAYSAYPQLAAAQPRLEDFVERGGTLIVQYQSSNFPAPLPLSMARTPERVVDEQSAVKLLNTDNPLLNWPNKITPADFDGWVEERGHSFLDSWDKGYTPLTETADAGQDPQLGGLLVTHPGKGTYIYVAYALYRQFPELVPGAYRLWANLLSAGANGTPTK